MANHFQLPILNNHGPTRCPSAQPGMEDARVLGVVQISGDERRVAYLDDAVPVTPDVLKMAGDVEPIEVMRFSAHCDERNCMHFDGTRCQLATRVAQSLPSVVDVLPACTIRPTCRWYLQEGPAVCERCPQIVTINDGEDEALIALAYGPEHADKVNARLQPDHV